MQKNSKYTDEEMERYYEFRNSYTDYSELNTDDHSLFFHITEYLLQNKAFFPTEYDVHRFVMKNIDSYMKEITPPPLESDLPSRKRKKN